ncbi:hypothetical protein N480_14340 [Pseudoalteromonas luteoviolacea S2607]|uniref:hypothetical protein n=1 Tax=Pseudoalteromonas luteoviolacea TaxID=43657 RepID=UPI0007B06C6E|nr:hypothetical protein [Pseudoalteromonas luteoviolacea]KZN37919.1 hypothetical protein N480_14340 [Pseudoalteromonas luteoviolacea S2607]
MKNFFILFVLLLSGCATGIDISTLNRVEPTTGFILEHYIENVGETGLVSVKEGLKKGIYKAEFEDQFGIYYRGPKNCVLVESSANYKAESDGGLWLPKEGSKHSPKIYAYIQEKNNQTAEKAGVIINALIERDWGRISFGTKIVDNTFLNQIKIIELN